MCAESTALMCVCRRSVSFHASLILYKKHLNCKEKRETGGVESNARQVIVLIMLVKSTDNTLKIKCWILRHNSCIHLSMYFICNLSE